MESSSSDVEMIYQNEDCIDESPNSYSSVNFEAVPVATSNKRRIGDCSDCASKRLHRDFSNLTISGEAKSDPDADSDGSLGEHFDFEAELMKRKCSHFLKDIFSRIASKDCDSPEWNEAIAIGRMAKRRMTRYISVSSLKRKIADESGRRCKSCRSIDQRPNERKIRDMKKAYEFQVEDLGPLGRNLTDYSFSTDFLIRYRETKRSST